MTNNDTQTVMQNLIEIDEWIANSELPTEFKTNDDIMRFSVEVMRRCLYLLRLGVSLVPDGTKEHQGFTKHRAIVVGHMVRIVKLYEGATIHISQQQCELALVFFRLIVETAIRMIYLITSRDKRKSCRSYILSSYKPEKDMLRDLEDKRIRRSLIPIERRMRRSILSMLRKDRITQSSLNKLILNASVNAEHERSLGG